MDSIETWVERDGIWWPGWLSRWWWTDRDTGKWRGVVTYTVDIGMTYYEAVNGDRLQPINSGTPDPRET